MAFFFFFVIVKSHLSDCLLSVLCHTFACIEMAEKFTNFLLHYEFSSLFVIFALSIVTKFEFRKSLKKVK